MKQIIIEGRISSEFELNKEKEKLTLLGSFSSASYLERNNQELWLICDESYGVIPFGIGIKDYSRILGKERINDKCIITAANHALHIINDDTEIIVHIKEQDAIERIKSQLSFKEFYAILEDKLFSEQKGVFKALVSDKFEDTVYSKKIKEILGSNIIADIRNNSDDFLLQLIGYGPGLTPSGDDFLCGYLYDKIQSGQSRDYEKMINRIKELMWTRTNRISCAYMKGVLEGSYYSLFENVCFNENEKKLKEAIDSLLMVGNNSGADILCGICYAKSENEHV